MLTTNLSSQVLGTKPIKYVLHKSFTDGYKFVKKNVAIALETLVGSLNHYIEQCDKVRLYQKKICADSDNTFTFLQKLRKNEDAITLSVDKGFIEYIKTTEKIVCDLKRFQDFLYRNFHETKIMK